MKVLYISSDGLLEPLGYSQVVRLVSKIRTERIEFTILSLEKPSDLERIGDVDLLAADLANSGVLWRPMPYKSGRGGAFPNLLSLLRASIEEVTLGIDLIHARSYVPALVALVVSESTQTPYIFDKRSYWIDEKRDAGAWFSNEFAYQSGKWIERQLMRRAAAIVSLTDIAANDIKRGVFGDVPEQVHVETITTLADFQAFGNAASNGAPSGERQGVFRTLEEVPVIGYVGSLNPSYDVSSALEVARLVLSQSPDFHFLGLTSQVDLLRERALNAGLPKDRVHVVSAPHSEMPHWLTVIDWGLLILNSTFAKRASMPTKLGEFFAAGVRPIQYGCNQEVSYWVREVGGGVVLGDVRQSDLELAAARIVDAPLRRTPRMNRALAAEHFSLEAGAEKFRRLYAQLAGE